MLWAGGHPGVIVQDLKRYIVINTGLVESLARQLSLPVDKERTSEGQFGFSVKVGGWIKRTTVQAPLPPDDPRLLPPIIDKLRKSGKLRTFRPNSMTELGWAEPPDWYVHETAIATPVIIPVQRSLNLSSAYMPETLTVWVADPVEPTRKLRDKWEILGSFVFIVQEVADLTSPRTAVSGLSALKMIVDVVAKGEELEEADLEELVNKPDKYASISNGDHPVERLQRIGAIPGRPRRIEAIYKVGYMSNDQFIGSRRRPRRLNDILAYPLFIAE
jgi:hypothetical protein